jgi:hypothetical protein
MGSQVNTVRGAIDTTELGVPLMHEHVFIPTTEIMHNYPEGWGDEAKPGLTFISGDQWLTRPGSVGTVVSGEMKVLDDDGVRCPPGEDLGQVPHAIVQPADGGGLDEAAVTEFLRERIAAYKVRRTVECTDAPLRDDAGRARRSAVRAEVSGRMREPAPEHR